MCIHSNFVTASCCLLVHFVLLLINLEMNFQIKMAKTTRPKKKLQNKMVRLRRMLSCVFCTVNDFHLLCVSSLLLLLLFVRAYRFMFWLSFAVTGALHVETRGATFKRCVAALLDA